MTERVLRPRRRQAAVLYGGYCIVPQEGTGIIAAQTGGPWAVIMGSRQVPYAVISGPVLMEQPRTR